MSEVCDSLHRLLHQATRFQFPFDNEAVPENGIYLLYECDENGHQGDRIVRIGSHTGDHKLRSRLREHFLVENKDRSIFRKNIGRALLCQVNDAFLEQWQLDLTSRAAKQQYANIVDFERQRLVEKAVTSYIQSSFSFVVIPVEDKADRLNLEAKLISTVAQCTACGPSRQWLGQFSPHQKIRESGLWQVRSLTGEPLSRFELSLLKARL